MRKIIYRTFVELTGNHFLSYLLKRFTASRFSRPLIKSFARTYKINQEEMEKSIEEYQSLQELFSRRLKAEARNLVHPPMTIVSPVDGTYMVLYLSPSHYHRIHSPVNGVVLSQWQLGRKSYPVNKWGLTYGKRPLSRNFRLITEVDCERKHLAIVKVGALNVNSIHSTIKDSQLRIGEEIGYFSFGSTVVLLFEKGMVSIDKSVKIPAEVRMGEKLGIVSQSDSNQ